MNTTHVIGRSPRKSPSLICLQCKLDTPIFDKPSFPVKNKVINVAIQKNRLQ